MCWTHGAGRRMWCCAAGANMRCTRAWRAPTRRPRSCCQRSPSGACRRAVRSLCMSPDSLTRWQWTALQAQGRAGPGYPSQQWSTLPILTVDRAASMSAAAQTRAACLTCWGVRWQPAGGRALSSWLSAGWSASLKRSRGGSALHFDLRRTCTQCGITGHAMHVSTDAVIHASFVMRACLAK